MRVIELTSIDNVRDYGGITLLDGRTIPHGLLYRGSALHSLAPEDACTLFDDLGITCVIDLRCGWECEAKPNTRYPGIEYLHIPFYDKEKVGIDYTENANGTEIVGRDIACEPDHFYRSLSNPLTVRQMRACVHEILDRISQGDPVYCHCSGGKDRTGIISILILTILGASEDDIMTDYLFTNIARDKTIDAVYERFLRLAKGDEERARELTESHRACPQNVAAFWESVSERYGSPADFIENQLAIDPTYAAHLFAS